MPNRVLLGAPCLLLALSAMPAAAQEPVRAVMRVEDVLAVEELASPGGTDTVADAAEGRRVRLAIRANRRWRLLVTLEPGPGDGDSVGVRVRPIEGPVRASGPSGADAAAPRAAVEVARGEAGTAVVELELTTAGSGVAGVRPTLVYTLAALD